MNQSNSARKRRLKFGAISTIFTAMFVVIIIILNVMASALYEKFPLALDFTKDSIYTLSDKATEYIKEVEQEVTITVVGNEDDFRYGSYLYKDVPSKNRVVQYMEPITEILYSLPKINDKISLSFKTQNDNADFYQNFSETMYEGQIIVQSGDRYKILDYYDYLVVVNATSDTDYSSYAQQGIYLQNVMGNNIENAICSSLLNITSEEIPLVTFLTGHDEVELAPFIATLSNNNFSTVTCNVVTGEIPENTEVLVISGSSRDFSETELNKLDAYLAKGKDLIYFANPLATELPNLNAFLNEWGIRVGDGVLEETSSSRYYQDPAMLLGQYGSTDYTKNIRAYPIVPISKPIEILWSTKANIAVNSIITTFDTAVVRPSSAFNDPNWTDDDAVLRGAFPVAVASTKTISADPENYSESTIVTFGSYHFVDDDNDPYNFLSNPSAGNADVILNILDDMTGVQADRMNLVTKVIDPKTLYMLKADVQVMGNVVMFVIPAVLILIALAIWIWRKNR